MSDTGNMLRAKMNADGVLVLTMDQPPANALDRALRSAIFHVLSAAPAHGARAVVLCGAGRNFSAASALDSDAGAPDLAVLCAMVEDMALPVVVALTGAAAGPGAELALAAHGRVMAADARIVFPEIGLGLVPGSGATQRLPRLVGGAEAVRMLVRGQPVTGAEAVAMGLADLLAEGDVVQAATGFAGAMPAPRPVRDRAEGLADVPAFQAAMAEARRAAARGILPAPLRMIDCIEAALMLPFANGLAMEAVAREDLVAGEESRGLIAAALAERRAAVLPVAVAQVRPKAVVRLGLAGAAPQMAALALIALNKGLSVDWVDTDESSRAASVRWIADRQAADLRAGRLSAVQQEADRARLTMTTEEVALTGCDLVVHGAAGAALDRLTRALPAVPQLVMGGAEGALGLGLAPSARLAELALPAAVLPEQVAVAVAVLRRLGLPPVLLARMPILGRRVSAAGRAALARLMAMGVPRRVLAAALDGFGQAMPDLPDLAEPAPMRAMAEDEVLRRWQGAMANEGLRLLDAQLVLRPSDIDLVLVAGYGFPRWRGGPMHHAAARGLMVLRRDLREWAGEDAALWTPYPLLDRMIADGRRLSDLDAAAV